MRLGELRQLLEDRGIRLTKSLGQNFLHDANQLRRAVGLAEVRVGDRVLEVGPGLGALTGTLLAAGAEVLAIEVDARLAAVLRERFGGDGRLRIEVADAVKFLRRTPRDWSEWKVAANLPYSAASPILVELALGAGVPERMVVTVQAEVARRLAAGPGTADYGLLTLLIAARFEVQGVFTVPPGCFFPAPRVESACIRLLRRAEPLVGETGLPVYVRLVKRAFSERRKRMVKLLKREWDEAAVRPAMRRFGIPEDARAETVSPEQFARLAACLAEIEGAEEEGEP